MLGRRPPHEKPFCQKCETINAKIFQRALFKKWEKFWATISPFFSDKRPRNGHNISLSENDNVETDPSNVSKLFDDYFSRVAMDIGFYDHITTTRCIITSTIPTRVLWKYDNMATKVLSVLTLLAKTAWPYYCAKLPPPPPKATGYDHILGKIARIAHQMLSFPITRLINTAIMQFVCGDNSQSELR